MGTVESGLKIVLEIVLPKGLVKTMFVRLTIALNCISHIELLFELPLLVFVSIKVFHFIQTHFLVTSPDISYIDQLLSDCLTLFKALLNINHYCCGVLTMQGLWRHREACS